jgi:hypothetical protein
MVEDAFFVYSIISLKVHESCSRINNIIRLAALFLMHPMISVSSAGI